MQARPRSTVNLYLLCVIAIIIAFACNIPSPQPMPVLNKGSLTATQKTIPPTKTAPTLASEPKANSQPENSNLSVNRKENFYQISGNTANELRQQLNKLGPLDKLTGKRFDARTDWFIEWHYYYNESKKDCKIDSKRVDVSLSITFTYPKWTSPSNATPALLDKWNTYMKNLVLHEEGHVTIASEGAQAIYKTILDMPASPTCNTLGEATNAAAKKILDEIKQREKDYDNKTGHGETQGAVFP